MRKYCNKQIVAGLFFGMFSVFYFANSFGLAERARYKGIGGDFMPKVYAILLFFCSTVQFSAGLKAYFKTKSTDSVYKTDMKSIKNNAVNVGLCFLLVLIYFLSMKIIGFTVSSIIFLFLLACLLIPGLCKRTEKLYLGIIVFSVLLPIVLYWFFRSVIYTPLPIGIIFSE